MKLAHDGSVYTMEIPKHYKSEFFIQESQSLDIQLALYWQQSSEEHSLGKAGWGRLRREDGESEIEKGRDNNESSDS